MGATPMMRSHPNLAARSRLVELCTPASADVVVVEVGEGGVGAECEGPEVLARPPRPQVGGDHAPGAGADEQVGVGGAYASHALEGPGDAGVVRHADRAASAEDDAEPSRSHAATVADPLVSRKSYGVNGY